MSNDTKNLFTLIDLILLGIARIDRLRALFEQSRAEGRDVSDAELDQLRQEDDAARAELDQKIADARAAGG